MPHGWVVRILGMMHEEGNCSALLQRLRQIQMWPLAGGGVAKISDGAVLEIADAGERSPQDQVQNDLIRKISEEDVPLCCQESPLIRRCCA